jgi:hypothetical protein
MVTGASVSFTAEEKQGMSRLSDIEERLRVLEKEAAKYARFPKEDQWPVGTVITYDVTMADQSVYTYAVLKAKTGAWYWTGFIGRHTANGDYDQLVEALAADNVSNIRVATPNVFELLFPMPEIEDPNRGETAEDKSAATYVPVVKRADG